MRFDEILRQCGICSNESIFSSADAVLLHADLPEMEEAVCCTVGEEQYLSAQPVAAAVLRQDILAQWEDYSACCGMLTQLSGALHLPELPAEERHQIRTRRKALLAEKAKLEESAAEQARMRLFGTPVSRKTICRKGVYAASVSSLCSALPQLYSLPGNSPLRQVPVFTDRIQHWRQQLSGSTAFAVEGGPCLFGADEAYVDVELFDGTVYSFDFATEEELEGRAPGLSRFALQHRGEGCRVAFRFWKDALTHAEYDSLVSVMDMAAAFSVNAYVPLPDFSYAKYMDAILEQLLLDPAERAAAMEQFWDGLRKVTKLYLDALEELQRRTPAVSLKVVYGENTALRQIYRERRSPFLNQESHMLKTLTTNEAKRQSILDYITMPSLPYYLDGITNIIQVDCVDETDSYRKCQKLHRNQITIYPFLYAEPLSRDGVHTVYWAKREDKGYRRENP